MTYRVLITGDRNWKCHALAYRIVRRLDTQYGAVTVIHGSARGVDSAFHDACLTVGVDVRRQLPPSRNKR